MQQPIPCPTWDTTLQAAFQSALAHHQAGEVVQAKRLYESILSQHPPHADSWYLLGMIAVEASLQDEALYAFQKALQYQPNHPEASRALADTLIEKCQPQDALNLYLPLLAQQPNDPQLRLLVADLSSQTGALSEAASHYQSLLAQFPQEATLYLALAKVQQAQERFLEALTLLQKAVGLCPPHPELFAQLGHLLQQFGPPQEALHAYQQALDLAPDAPSLHYNIGVVQFTLKKHPDAVAAFETAVRLDPGYLQAWQGLGMAYPQINQGAKALQAYDKAFAISHNPAEKIKAAMTFPCIYRSQADLDHWIQRQEQAVADLASLDLSSIQDPMAEIGLVPFYGAYQGTGDLDRQWAWGKILSPLVRQPALPHINRNGGKKPKIGLVSRHFQKRHTLGKLNRGLIEHLNRNLFEVVVFQPDDAFTREEPVWDVSGEIDWFSVNRLAAAQDVILSHQLDFLFYPDLGMEPFTAFLAMSRLAPVQLTTWGHPITSGLETMDYFVSFSAMESENPQQYYHETLAMFQNSLVCYERPERVPASPREHYGFTAKDHLYICSQSLFKILPAMDSLFQGILEADPQAKIVFIEGINPTWHQTLAARWEVQMGKTLARRMCVVPRMAPKAFIGFQAMADVLLDTTVFGGGNTSLEAFSMGIPIITMPGPYGKGRVTDAWYRMMGIQDCTADSSHDYIAKAVRAVCDKEYGTQLRQRILTENHVLFHNTQGVRELESWLLERYEEDILSSGGMFR